MRRSVIVMMAALGVAVVLVWSASTGPANLAEGVPARPVVEASTSAHPDRAARAETRQEPQHATATSRRLTTGISWLDDLIGVVAFVAAMWLLGLLVRKVMNVVGPRLPDKQLVVDLEPLPDLEAARESLTRDQDRLLDALHAASDVRNGIVACWVMLEEEAAGAGVVRRPSETPTEFVVRFLHTLDVDPRPVAGLADLYREARFSTHPMGPDARTRAEAAIRAVHDELASGVPA